MTRVEVVPDGPPIEPQRHANKYRGYKVLIDGVSVPCLCEGFSVTFPEGATLPLVTMSIWADDLRVELPEAVLKATTVPDGREIARSLDEYRRRNGIA